MNSVEGCTDERKVVVVSVVVRKVDLLCARGRGARIPHRHHVVDVHAHDPETEDEDALEAEADNIYAMSNERCDGDDADRKQRKTVYDLVHMNTDVIL